MDQKGYAQCPLSLDDRQASKSEEHDEEEEEEEEEEENEINRPEFP